MPILAGIPVVPDLFTAIDPFQESRTLMLRSLDGLDLLPFTGNEFFARQGIEGLDLPPLDVVRETIPGMDGTRLREIRTLERAVFLPLFLRSATSHADYLDKRDLLSRMLGHEGKDYVAYDGTFDLVANSLRGERSLRCVYVDGMTGSRAADASGAWWDSLGLNLIACRPYWTGAPWLTPIIRTPAPVSWFGTFPGELTSSRAFGVDIPITVDGDLPSWVTLDIVGPATSVTVTAPGLSISIPAAVATGETVQLVTDPRGRTALFDGVKDWGRVAPTDTYKPIPQGNQVISVVVAGATSATSAQISGQTSYKRAW